MESIPQPVRLFLFICVGFFLLFTLTILFRYLKGRRQRKLFIYKNHETKRCKRCMQKWHRVVLYSYGVDSAFWVIALNKEIIKEDCKCHKVHNPDLYEESVSDVKQ